MILFYSEYCEHCNLLLETIKRHDTEKIIKLVSIDLLRSLKKNISSIHSVPALMFSNTKEIIYGKAVFDYLLLPNRGILFAKKNTREKDYNKIDTTVINTKINDEIIDEPMAFSLGSVLSDNFANIDDDNINSMNKKSDKNYNWTSLDNDNKQDSKDTFNKNNDSKKTNNSLPSIEEIMKEREKDIL